MKTYSTIDEFIMEAFPIEHRKITKERKSDIAEYIENANAEFDEKLEAILKGEKEEQKT